MPMTDVGLACLAGAVFTCALLSITQAYRIARVAAVAPFEYSYLVWVTLLGYLMFGDLPGPRTVFGAALVVFCGLYILYRRATTTGLNRRQKKSPVRRQGLDTMSTWFNRIQALRREARPRPRKPSPNNSIVPASGTECTDSTSTTMSE